MSSTFLGVRDHGSAGGSAAVSLACSDSKCKATGKTPLVAIVDDDIWVRKSLERLMKSAGFKTEAFASAEDFLNSQSREQTTCIILDLRLPQISGLQLQGHLAAEHRLIPISLYRETVSQKPAVRPCWQARLLFYRSHSAMRLCWMLFIQL